MQHLSLNIRNAHKSAYASPMFVCLVDLPCTVPPKCSIALGWLLPCYNICNICLYKPFECYIISQQIRKRVNHTVLCRFCCDPHPTKAHLVAHSIDIFSFPRKRNMFKIRQELLALAASSAKLGHSFVSQTSVLRKAMKSYTPMLSAAIVAFRDATCETSHN